MNKKSKKIIIILSFISVRLIFVSLLITLLMIFINHPGIKSKNKRELVNNLKNYPLIAHRGYFNDGVAENSLEAFKKAVQSNISIELDVHLTTDKKLIVYHDEKLGENGVKPLDSYTTAQQEIISRKILEKPIYTLSKKDITDVCDNFLVYNTKMNIPELYEVIQIVKEHQKPNQRTLILVEIKANSKNSKNYINELCQTVSDFINNKNDDSIEFAVQSFHPLVVKWFKSNNPDIIRGFLSKDFIKSPKNNEPSGIVGFLLANNYLNFLTRPDFISYGLAKNKPYPIGQKAMFQYQKVRFSWTIKSEEDFIMAQNQGFTNFIFDSVDAEKLKKLIK